MTSAQNRCAPKTHAWNELYTCSICGAIKYASEPLWARCTKLGKGGRGARSVWLALWTCADRDTESPPPVHPGNQTLADRSGQISERRVQEHLAWLQCAGWIRRTPDAQRHFELAWGAPNASWAAAWGVANNSPEPKKRGNPRLNTREPAGSIRGNPRLNTREPAGDTREPAGKSAGTRAIPFKEPRIAEEFTKVIERPDERQGRHAAISARQGWGKNRAADDPLPPKLAQALADWPGAGPWAMALEQPNFRESLAKCAAKRGLKPRAVVDVLAEYDRQLEVIDREDRRQRAYASGELPQRHEIWWVGGAKGKPAEVWLTATLAKLEGAASPGQRRRRPALVDPCDQETEHERVARVRAERANGQ